MGRRASKIELSVAERHGLEELIRTRSTPQHLALRARIIVLAADGLSVGATSERLGVWRKTVSEWRKRWLACGREVGVADRLSDRPRKGAPATITPEQICAIIALACEKPSESGIPISHWSQQAVAEEAMRRGIVEKISQRSVGRFFKRVGLEATSHPLLADGQARPAV
jgi:transposase|tara:strand:- start:736 stop:1242 length:507 start_codon:yes stop_codon:yes gene_type:complete